MFTHVVLFKLVDPVADVERVRQGLLALRDEIPGILGLEVGVDVLRQERSYDVALIVRFDSRAAHDAYQAHPAHRAFAELLRPLRSHVAAVDFEL
ncbi:MAG TPA: Dabb family protein [Polyangiaceae bacterium]|nr:Dabb family protein [Polyangiaceae bacterium]